MLINYNKNLTGNQLIYDKKNYLKLMNNPITDKKHTKTFNSCSYGNLLDLQSVGDSYFSFALVHLTLVGKNILFFFAQSSGVSRGGSRVSLKPPLPTPCF